MSSAPDLQWIKVGFYGQMPDGQVITDVDTAEVAKNLAQIFGFRYITGLSVAVAPDQGDDQ